MKYDLSEINALIHDRRTIYPQNFTDRIVQREIVETILTNATWAPTHGKTQPWRFKVFDSAARDQLKSVLNGVFEKNNTDKLESIKMGSRIDKSSVTIALVMARTPGTRIPEQEEMEAVACAAQNILLTATAYGLGAFWSSPKFIYETGAAEAFGYKPEDKLMGFIYLGYPEGDWPKGHRKPLEYSMDWVS
jgi:nitroreductase